MDIRGRKSNTSELNGLPYIKTVAGATGLSVPGTCLDIPVNFSVVGKLKNLMKIILFEC